MLKRPKTAKWCQYSCALLLLGIWAVTQFSEKALISILQEVIVYWSEFVLRPFFSSIVRHEFTLVIQESQQSYFIAETCSGILSVKAILILTGILVVDARTWPAAVYISLLAIPTVVLTNLLRICSSIVLCQFFPSELILGVGLEASAFHWIYGITLGVGCLLLLANLRDYLDKKYL